MLLLGLLPLAALALTIEAFRRRSNNHAEAILLGILTWAFAIALGSEALSLSHAITFESVLACWSLALVALAFWNADRFARWMGMQGLRGVSKIVALLLAAIAVSLIRRGWNAPG
jgi:small neutral amino acid transporter SnatA (MarC family)